MAYLYQGHLCIHRINSVAYLYQGHLWTNGMCLIQQMFSHPLRPSSLQSSPSNLGTTVFAKYFNTKGTRRGRTRNGLSK